MCTENFIITKRDGTTERFSLDKIKSAILKAFTSLHQPIDAQGLQRVIEHLRFCNGMSVEDIQNQVEVALMAEKHFKVAKAFMLYRQQHTEDRDVAERLSFMFDYCDADRRIAQTELHPPQPSPPDRPHQADVWQGFGRTLSVSARQPLYL